MSPSSKPSSDPSSIPSEAPTGGPTLSPSSKPSGDPSSIPSEAPTGGPTPSPSSKPSREPSRKTTVDPTVSPASFPSREPSNVATDLQLQGPSESIVTENENESLRDIPIAPEPSGGPTLSPASDAPTMFEASAGPTLPPGTESPTGKPSGLFHGASYETVAPTGAVSFSPSSSQTIAPTVNPVETPSSQPSMLPTGEPSKFPTSLQPTDSGTLELEINLSINSDEGRRLDEGAILDDISLQFGASLNQIINTEEKLVKHNVAITVDRATRNSGKISMVLIVYDLTYIYMMYLYCLVLLIPLHSCSSFFSFLRSSRSLYIKPALLHFRVQHMHDG